MFDLKAVSEETIDSCSGLLSSLGVQASPFSNPELFLNQIHKANPRHKGQDLKRWQVLDFNNSLTLNVKKSINALACQFGLKGQIAKPQGRFDVIMILAGGMDHNQDMADWLAKLVNKGDLKAKEIVFGCAYRVLEEDELKLFPSCQTEVDLCQAAAHKLRRSLKSEVKVSVLPAAGINTPSVLQTIYDYLAINNYSSLLVGVRQHYGLSVSLDLQRLLRQLDVSCQPVVGRRQNNQSLKSVLYLVEILRTLRAAVFGWHNWDKEAIDKFFSQQEAALKPFNKS